MNDEMLRGISEQFIKEVRCDLKVAHKSEIEVYKDQIERLTAENEDLKVEVEDTTEQYCSDILELRREVEALTVLLKLKL